MTKPKKDQDQGNDELEGVTGGMMPGMMPGVTNAGFYASAAGSVVGAGLGATGTIISSKDNLKAIDKNHESVMEQMKLDTDNKIKLMKAQQGIFD